MPIPSSGPLSLTDIQTEFGGTNPIGLSEYYAGGGLVPAGTTGTYGAVPSSGTISIQNFYGTANLYAINNSLRFRSSASAWLNRTPSTAGNRQTWTWSGWVKRGILTTEQIIFAANPDQNNHCLLQWSSTGDALRFTSNQGGAAEINLITTAQYRDPSAWYHIVCVANTSSATQSQRARLYVNGTEITSFSTATRPAGTGHLTSVNNTVAHFEGRYPNSSILHFDGYLAEVYLVDGQALTPSSFGETSTTTGSWIPKSYTGTYGTNGFYQKYSSIALTSGSNTGLGQDFSGNGNFWNTNNISVTAGTTYDAMTDSPTPASATVGNYCVLNPLNKDTSITVTNGNLAASSGGTNIGVTGSFAISGGKWYWEITQTAGGVATSNIVGITDATLPAKTAGLSTNSYGYGTGTTAYKWNNSVNTAYGSNWTNGDVISVAFDADAGTITFYKNNVSQGTAFTGISGTFYPAFGFQNTSAYAVNFGQRPFAYTPPTGFVALNTFNIPTSTIVKGNSYMDATLYTGTGASLSVTNAASFRPDFVWVKGRSGATDHALYDAVRGTTNDLVSNSTAAATTQAQGLTAFNSNGFTVGTLAKMNTNTATYVGWQWQAGSSTVTNTSGSISAQVRANTTTGFSIVTYTGTGANATVGHGLGVAPKMIIVKGRTNVDNWQVYHSNLTSAAFRIILNTTAAQTSQPAVWNSTAPTSSVFSLGTGVSVNQSGQTFVAYCWAEIAGFSAFGRYTGNGSSDGTFVYTGFRPKFILFKGASNVTEWQMIDTSRSTYNIQGASLQAQSSAAEITTQYIDILSNGFKFRTAFMNDSGQTFIYAAFAENPFKNANAR
jgi:hypothetical protein